MSEFRKVEPLVFDSGYWAAAIAQSGQYVILRGGIESLRFDYEQSIALQDWFASATGYYPKEQK